ncbi:unnamed protein product [marine sediment metagenome]|uniref:Methyltransferase type 11 domain-containing protein n=1 Tax=marine sediment metagenome TaxID=412755 RepID=X1GZN9_9ZZZZ
MKKKKLNQWKETYELKNIYCTEKRFPFFKIAADYLPNKNNSLIVDVGTGDASFVDSLGLDKKYENLYLLDKNQSTIRELKKRFKNAILYKVPDRLPFDNKSVDFIHCSHLIEHLYYDEFYKFLKEIDRVMKINGVLVFSAPLYWEKFYGNPSHIKPYNPESIILNFCYGMKNLSNDEISESYSLLKLIYRYSKSNKTEEGLGSSLKSIDLLISFIKWIFSKLFKVYNYRKSGYTIVLKKEL